MNQSQSSFYEMSGVERFNLLYKESFDKVCRFANFYVHCKPVAEDIVMDSFLKLFEIMTSEKIETPMALLLTIVKHKALDYLKAQLNRQDTEQLLMQREQRELSIRISTLEACNPSDIFSHEIRSIVMCTLDKMPKQTKTIFLMSRMQNKSVKEIAHICGISVKGVDYHIGRALKVLRMALKDYLLFLGTEANC